MLRARGGVRFVMVGWRLVPAVGALEPEIWLRLALFTGESAEGMGT